MNVARAQRECLLCLAPLDHGPCDVDPSGHVPRLSRDELRGAVAAVAWLARLVHQAAEQKCSAVRSRDR